MIVEPCRIVVIDLCAAIIATRNESKRLRFEAALQLLGQHGVEVGIYSALDAWSTRRALRMAGIMEMFDYVWHMDAMMKMRSDELADLRDVKVLNTPDELCVRQMIKAAGIPLDRVPPWMRWLT